LVCYLLGGFFLDGGRVLLELYAPFFLLREIPFSFCLDFVSLFFFSSVSIISSIIFLYRSFYIRRRVLEEGVNNGRFFFLLFFFVVSIMVLVFSGSWVVVMAGWDGLGLVSFLLVVFYNNASSLDSGLITVFTNRVGDCLFIIRFILIFYSGWIRLEFLSIGGCIGYCTLLVLGCATKRAQVPFSSWLPAAIAAPTPVSSLVHSSTLVTAGVYLMIRFGFLLRSFYFVLIVISLVTIVLAGVGATLESDFKKVVAMSTLRQLGFIVFSLSCGYWLLSFVHIIFHAFFKSSLFLSTGGLIHYLLGGQDSRFFGSLGSSYFSKLLFVIRRLSLMGFPFSIGFYSKDTLLADIAGGGLGLIRFIFLLGCVFTVAYSIRLIRLGFYYFPSFDVSLIFRDSKIFYFPVRVLYFYCVFAGGFFFSNLVPPSCLSFMEGVVGLLVIVRGWFCRKAITTTYPLFFFFSIMGGLVNLRSSTLSSYLRGLSVFREYTWSEVVGGKGVLFFIKSIQSVFLSYFYLYTMFFFIFMIGFLLLL